MKIKSKAKYIDRTLIKHHFKIILCKTEKDFYLELTIHRVPLKDYPEWLTENAYANTHTILIPKKNKTTKKLAIVCIKPKDKDYISHLIHEAVHIWWREVEYIQEANPSEEVEAYSIEAIASNLIKAYKGTK